MVAASCNDLGVLARGAGELDEAGAYFERAHELWRQIDDATGVARTAHNLAWIMVARGDLDRAGDLLLETLAESSSIDNRHLRAFALAAVTTVAATRAPRRAAATLYGATQAELEAAGVVLEPLEEEAFQQAESVLRTALGAKEFEAAAARGRALGEADQRRLVERILGPAQPPEASPLTRRELEVVRLMAAGLTNGEIADEARAERSHRAPARRQHPPQARRPHSRRRRFVRSTNRAPLETGPDGPSEHPGAKLARPGDADVVAPRDPRRTVIRRARRDMPLVRVTVIEGVFSASQKRQIVEGVTEVLIAVEGEGIRAITWVIVDEVGSGDWGVGGRALTTEDVKGMAAAAAA